MQWANAERALPLIASLAMSFGKGRLNEMDNIAWCYATLLCEQYRLTLRVREIERILA